MKTIVLFQTLVLLFAFDLCFAQRLVQPAQGHFGFYSYHYFAREITANITDGAFPIIPLRNQIGLTGEWSLGDHFGLGAHISYRHLNGQSEIDFGYRYRLVFIPLENRIISYDYHQGVIDLYGRWYLQERRKALRTFIQLNFGTNILYGGKYSYPYHLNPDLRDPQTIGFNIGGEYFVALGAGLQYRIDEKWGMDTAIMINWPISTHTKPFYFSQYGLQLGVYRVITQKKTN